MLGQERKTLWESLGLNSADVSERQIPTRRVVVVGDAFSGKRTFTSRLFAAATQYFSSTSISSIDGGGSGIRSGKLTLPHATELEVEADAGSSGRSSSVACTSIYTGCGSAVRHLVQFPHGAGIAQAFIMHRVSLSRSSLVSHMEDGVGNRTVYRGSFGPGGLGGGVRRAVTEFYCCDAPGALAMALPTVEALENSVVLIVVDAGAPWYIHDQLQRWYAHLNAHVVHTLRTELPKQDEVRCMCMIEQQQRFWNEQQKALGAVQRRWREGEDEKNRDGATLPVLQVPKGGVCPLRTMLLCSNVDQLEKLSREAEKMCRGGPSVFSRNTTASTHTPAQAARASHCMISTLRTTGLSLLELVGQLLRKEAIERQSGLVGIGSRVNTTTTSIPSQPQPTTTAPVRSTGTFRSSFSAEAADAISGNSQGTFVHPFYKNLWRYIFHLLYEPRMLHGRNDGGAVAAGTPVARGTAEDSSNNADIGSRSALPVGSASPHQSLFDEIEWLISSKFHPHAFLPHGIDHLELLNPFVTSTDAVTFGSLFGLNVEATGAATPGDEETNEEDDVLQLHERYMQQIENILATAKPNNDVMIWDHM